jgi:hypothetical protein
MKRIIISLLVVLAFVLTLAAPTFASGSQTWYLFKDGRINAMGQYMKKGVIPTASNDLLDPQYHRTWISDESAVPPSGVTFAAGKWTLVLNSDANLGDAYDDYYVVVGEYYNDGSKDLHPFNLNFIVSSSSNPVIMVADAPESKKVRQGGFLYLDITNKSASTRTIFYGENSRLSSPEGDPGYPLPELAGGVLLGAGLLGLGAFVYLRSKNSEVKT